ncbi:MAG: DUF4405 domain-containing protein [Agathobacter sp.]
MKPKMKIKMAIDFLMTILLLFLMAYQITGQELHEWLGAGMLLLFILHSFLNIRWYSHLLKGKYKLQRMVQTAVNFSVLICILCLGFSGVVMSRYVFAVFPFHGPMATARSMHMAASYWGFVLMCVHLGMHWGQVCGIFRRLLKGEKLSGMSAWLLRLAAIVIAGYGLFCFGQKNIISYMFLKNQFVFFDFEQSVLSVLIEYIAMMGFWTSAGFGITRGIGKISTMKSKRKAEC